MKVFVETDAGLLETEVFIRCAEADSYIESMVAGLRMYDRRILGTSGDETLVIPVGEILYAESVDGRTFVYTHDLTLEVNFKLYELEERLDAVGFVRVAKNCLVNLYSVTKFRPYVGGRILATLNNGEDVVVSRKYAKDIKRMLAS